MTIGHNSVRTRRKLFICGCIDQFMDGSEDLHSDRIYVERCGDYTREGGIWERCDDLLIYACILRDVCTYRGTHRDA